MRSLGLLLIVACCVCTQGAKQSPRGWQVKGAQKRLSWSKAKALASTLQREVQGHAGAALQKLPHFKRNTPEAVQPPPAPQVEVVNVWPLLIAAFIAAFALGWTCGRWSHRLAAGEACSHHAGLCPLGAHLPSLTPNMQADAHSHRRPRQMCSLRCKLVRSTAELILWAALVLLANFSCWTSKLAPAPSQKLLKRTTRRRTLLQKVAQPGLLNSLKSSAAPQSSSRLGTRLTPPVPAAVRLLLQMQGQGGCLHLCPLIRLHHRPTTRRWRRQLWQMATVLLRTPQGRSMAQQTRRIVSSGLGAALPWLAMPPLPPCTGVC